jgi:hypothetical protein
VRSEEIEISCLTLGDVVLGHSRLLIKTGKNALGENTGEQQTLCRGIANHAGASVCALNAD